MGMNTILKYPGSKWRIADWIIEHFPAHKVYCEPFFGSGAVFFNKPPLYIETINDIDGDVVNLFRICREYPDELAQLDCTYAVCSRRIPRLLRAFGRPH